MIPKKIHYFWFSGDPIPAQLLQCINSWKVIMPDYELMRWDLTNTPLDCEFSLKAHEEKQWAFLTDYARFRILYEQGGIYLDTDVLVLKPFDELLSYNSFWGRADNGLIEPVVFGSVKNDPIVKSCLDIYLNKSNEFVFKEIPLEILPIFELKGFQKEILSVQKIGETMIFPFDYFCPMPFEMADSNDPHRFKTENTLAIHLWNAAWFDPFRFFWNGRHKKGWKEVFRIILKNPFQSWRFYRNVGYHFKCAIFGYPS